jgi:hypothetical protein
VAAILQSLAVVGITDLWNQTVCAFQERFPRLDKKPYAAKGVNLKPATNKQREQDVSLILQQASATDIQYNGIPDPAERHEEHGHHTL